MAVPMQLQFLSVSHESHDCFCITSLIALIHFSISVLTPLKSIFYSLLRALHAFSTKLTHPDLAPQHISSFSTIEMKQPFQHLVEQPLRCVSRLCVNGTHLGTFFTRRQTTCLILRDYKGKKLLFSLSLSSPSARSAQLFPLDVSAVRTCQRCVRLLAHSSERSPHTHTHTVIISKYFGPRPVEKRKLHCLNY